MNTNTVALIAASATLACAAASSASVVWTGIGNSGAQLETGVSSVFMSSKQFPGMATAASLGAGFASASVFGNSILLEASSDRRYGASVSFDAVAYSAETSTFSANWSGMAQRTASLQIVRVSANNDILDLVMSTDATAGTQDVQLDSGNYYRFIFSFASVGGSSTAHFDASISTSATPAPGALALLSVAGVVGTRRRR